MQGSVFCVFLHFLPSIFRYDDHNSIYLSIDRSRALRYTLGVCQVRRLAVRLLVDDFRLGVGPEGASLARAVLLPSASLDGSNTTGGRSTLSFTTAGGWRAGHEGNGAAARGDARGTLLACLLQHRATLVETDGEGYDLSHLESGRGRGE